MKNIRTWEELGNCESEYYKVDVDFEDGGGWVVPKFNTDETERDYFSHHEYLTTHSFSALGSQVSNQILKKFGFNARIIPNY